MMTTGAKFQNPRPKLSANEKRENFHLMIRLTERWSRFRFGCHKSFFSLTKSARFDEYEMKIDDEWT